MKISEHAKERYAERIIEKERKADIVEYIRNNEEKINADIMKMLEYGNVIYEESCRESWGN